MAGTKWEDIYAKQGKEYHYYDIFAPHKDMPQVTSVFKKQKIRTVLDLGCGAGRNLFYLSREGFETHGMDSAPSGIRLLKKRLSEMKLKATLRVGSFFDKLPYDNGAFGAVISVQSLQHGTEKQIKGAVDEIERVLAPKGLVFITLSGRLSKGKVRLFLVKTAKKIAEHTYVPTQGDEKGLTHFIYNKDMIQKHFKNFKILKIWKDEKDYYCFIAQKRR